MTATTRQSIADALSTVDGITGYAKRPDVLGEGIGWARPQRLTRGPGQAWQTTWSVIVLLSGDEHTASDQLDELAVTLPDALLELLFVDSITPYAQATDAGEFFGIELIARSE